MRSLNSYLWVAVSAITISRRLNSRARGSADSSWPAVRRKECHSFGYANNQAGSECAEVILPVSWGSEIRDHSSLASEKLGERRFIAVLSFSAAHGIWAG